MKVLIVDDEPLSSKYLKGLIEKHCFEISQVEMLNQPLEALEHLKTNTYNIIFLDVEMPELDGFELLEQANLPSTTQVIFTTAYSQYAVDAFKANATHYLVKMVDAEDLVKAVRKVSKILQNQLIAKKSIDNQNSKAISIFHEGEHHILKEDEIIRFKAEGSYTLVVLADKQFLSTKGIGYFEKTLTPSLFCRCHHSHIVNIKMISKIGKGKKGYVVLLNEELIPLTSTKKSTLETLLGL